MSITAVTYSVMNDIHSKLTAQGQISVPVEVRRRLGVGPGSVLAWEWRDGAFLVRRAGRSTSTEIHEAGFGPGPHDSAGPTDVKAGIRKYIRKRHARG